MSTLTNQAEPDDAQRRLLERSVKALERLNISTDEDAETGLSEAERLARRASPPPLRTDGEPVGSPTSERLTEAQRAFAEGIVQGKTQRKAYRDAFKCEGSSDEVVSVSASRLMKQRKIQALIRAGRERTAEAIAGDPERTRDYVLVRLVELSQTARQEGSQIKALELLGKTVALFIDRQQGEDSTPDAAALKAALAHHLTGLTAAAPPAAPVPALPVPDRQQADLH